MFVVFVVGDLLDVCVVFVVWFMFGVLCCDWFSCCVGSNGHICCMCCICCIVVGVVFIVFVAFFVVIVECGIYGLCVVLVHFELIVVLALYCLCWCM